MAFPGTFYPGTTYPAPRPAPPPPPTPLPPQVPLSQSLTVEVRDSTLARRGVILPKYLDAEVHPAHNNVGGWQLRLPAEHPMVPVLRTPGAGIIVTGPDDVLLSGPVTKPALERGVGDPLGTVTFTGVSDTVVLADALAYPEPSNPDVSTQAVAYDKRTGPAESVMHAYVNANIGPGAPADRRGPLASKLVMGPDQGRGLTVPKQARFPVLGELLHEIAVLADLGFRVVQRGNDLVFETFEIKDLTRFIRLDIENGGLSSQSVETSGPGVTRVLVAGQGEGKDRTIIERSTTTSVEGEESWGRRIERFKDQRNTDELLELQQAGDEILADEGFTSVAVKAIPADHLTMQYGKDWSVGDRITVVVDGQETTSTVTGAVILANKSGVRVGAAIGDVTGFDPATALADRVASAESRVSALERNAEAKRDGLVWEEVPILPGLGLDPYTPGQIPVITKQGNDVTFCGSLRVTTAQNLNVTWANLDEEFWPFPAPVEEPVFHLQGSSTNHWCMRVYSDGRVTAERYSTSPAPVDTWLPFYVTWKAP